MKYNLRTKEALTIENSPQTDICSEIEVNPNPSSGLTQQMSNLTIENKFHISPGSILFIPDTADKVYKIQVLEHLLEEPKVRYIGWGPDYDSLINSESIWSYWCFKKPSSKLKRISKELSDQADDMLINAEIAPYVDEALAGLNSERIRTNGNLPDRKTLLHTKVPTIRYVPINVRYKWSEIFSDVIADCIEDPNTELIWRKLFGLSKCILRASNRRGQKHRRNNDQRFLERIKRWNSGEFAGLWNEACSVKQSKRSNDTSSEDIIKRAKNLSFQGQYGRAAKVLTSDGFAPLNKATLDSVKKLHPTKRTPIVVQSFSSQAYQSSEENVSEQLNSFSRFTAAGPSKMFPEHLLHAVQCTASDQSQIALRVLTKLVNISCRGELPKLDVGVKCGEEAIIHSNKLSSEKILTSSSSSGILQIDICNAFISIKRSEMLKAVAS